MGKRTALLGLAVTGAVCSAGGAHGEDRTRTAGTLCHAGETVVFSCETEKRKAVSVCSGPSHAGSAGVLRYRFGRPGAVELELPKASAVAGDTVEGNKDVSTSGNMLAFLRFRSEGYAYVVQEWSIHPVGMACGGPCNGAGIVVEKEGRRVGGQSCNLRAGGRTVSFDLSVLEQPDLPASSEFPDPDSR